MWHGFEIWGKVKEGPPKGGPCKTISNFEFCDANRSHHFEGTWLIFVGRQAFKIRDFLVETQDQCSLDPNIEHSTY